MLVALALVRSAAAQECHDPLTIGGPLSADYGGCVTSVCGHDPYCCSPEGAWDGLCVEECQASLPAPAPAAGGWRNGARRFYVTNEEVPGDAVLTACEAGFHVASLFELTATPITGDPTRGHPGYRNGAPNGWIYIAGSSDSPYAGEANCFGHTSAASIHYGSYVFFRETDATNIHRNPAQPAGWLVGMASCNNTRSVVCIED